MKKRNLKFGNHVVDLIIKGKELTVRNVNGDVSTREKQREVLIVAKNWCDCNNIPITAAKIIL